MSKTKALYHLVFSTKDRDMTITPECREKLYRYITTLTKEHDSVMYRVGGIANHVHMCIDLSPNVALAVFMQHIKSKTSFVIKHERWSEIFRGWGSGYYGCTISPGHAEALVEYILRIKRFIITQHSLMVKYSGCFSALG